MKVLPQIQLVIADCKNIGDAICAIRETLQHITPGRVTFFTDVDLEVPGVEIIKIPPIRSKRQYSEFMMKEVWKYITLPYILIIQGDGFVINSDVWSDEFLEFDVVGSPWPMDHDRQVGNHGFALNSKRVREIVGQDDFIDVLHPEDQSLSVIYRFYLEEKYGIKFAPVEVAERFGFELIEPTQFTVGFHGTHWEPYKEHIMITRRDSLGDVVMVEAILHYYYKKGYNVILNTLPQFQNLFTQHWYPIKLPHEVNSKIKFREVNLNMAYEAFPKMNHLDAYYQACGIPKEDRIMRNPILTLDFDTKLPQNKLFQKYAVIHIDRRAQGGRNINGVDWKHLVEWLATRGIIAVQIGRGEHIEIPGAIQMNCVTELMLIWVLGGADIFIGIDSGPANIAVAMNTPAVIFSGSVDLRLIYPDLSNICWINLHDKPVCDKPLCWHSIQGVQGIDCYIDNKIPPCTRFNTFDVITKIDAFIKQRIEYAPRVF